MKKHLYLMALAAFLGGLSSFWILIEVQAQIDSFTFFIPYPADILDNQFDVGHAALNLADDDIETTISVAVHRDNTLIHYDQWEDGLESDITRPSQPTTYVWGDDNPANGIPPGFATDILNAGDVVILRNLVSLPRDPASLFYDGGDALTAIGGAVATTLAVWPIHTPNPSVGIVYAGAWELYSTNKWGSEYLIPIGEDLAGVRGGFTVVGLNIQAVLDNTSVQLDLDADGNVDTTVQLDKGEQFTQIDGIMVGAHIIATDPIQVHVFAADPASRYEGRAFTIVPIDQWANDFLAPRSSDGDFWLYNPNDSILEVAVQTFMSTATITIPANSTLKYPPAGLSRATGVRFTSTDGRPFHGVVALDANEKQDWGYALLPINRLSTQALMGFGPGNNNDPPDGDQSRIYVTAVTTTTVFVDYDNNGSPDASFLVSPLQEVPITDPDNDLTGAYLFTDNSIPFVAVWGQDESAEVSLPSIDIGTTVVPLPSILVQKTVNSLIGDADCTGTVTLGDTIHYTLEYFNNTIAPVAEILIEDTLPPEVTYVENSAILIRGPVTGPIPDSGTTSFPFDEGGYNVGHIPVLDYGTLTFDVIINNPSNLIINRAEATSIDPPAGSDSSIVLTPADTAVDPVYQIDNRLIDPLDGLVTSGDAITFGLVITNTSNDTFTKFPLQITFNQTHLTFQHAGPQPDIINPGIISWNDLTDTFGDLLPGMTISLSDSFIVNELPPTVTTITNAAVGNGGEHSDGSLLPICNDVANAAYDISSPTPSPTPDNNGTPSVTPSSTPGNGGGTPSVTPSSTPGNGSGTPSVTPSSTSGNGGGTPSVTPSLTPGDGTPSVTPSSTPGNGNGTPTATPSPPAGNDDPTETPTATPSSPAGNDGDAEGTPSSPGDEEENGTPSSEGDGPGNLTLTPTHLITQSTSSPQSGPTVILPVSFLPETGHGHPSTNPNPVWFLVKLFPLGLWVLWLVGQHHKAKKKG